MVMYVIKFRVIVCIVGLLVQVVISGLVVSQSRILVSVDSLVVSSRLVLIVVWVCCQLCLLIVCLIVVMVVMVSDSGSMQVSVERLVMIWWLVIIVVFSEVMKRVIIVKEVILIRFDKFIGKFRCSSFCQICQCGCCQLLKGWQCWLSGFLVRQVVVFRQVSQLIRILDKVQLMMLSGLLSQFCCVSFQVSKVCRLRLKRLMFINICGLFSVLQKVQKVWQQSVVGNFQVSKFKYC